MKRGRPIPHAPKRRKGYGLYCAECNFEFADNSTVETMQAHMEIMHGTEEVHLNMRWKGPGPEPRRK